MRYIFLLLIFISCSPKKDFVLWGDWKFDNIFKEEAIKNIKTEPKKYLSLFVEKFFS